MSFFKELFKKKKTPTQLVNRAIFELNVISGKTESDAPKKLLHRLEQMKDYLNPPDEKEPILEKCNELGKAFIDEHLTIMFLNNFSLLTQEEINAFVTVYICLITQDYSHFASEYMLSPDGAQIFQMMFDGYKNPLLAVHCGSMIRECIKKRELHNYLLTHDLLLQPLFEEYCQNPNFDIASDAFLTIHELLRKNKSLISQRLAPPSELYTHVFTWYATLIQSPIYITQRQSLKLLGEFLLDKVNFDIMMYYICDINNLKTIMSVLRNPSPAIQFEAFHVFKVFVANPRKPAQIISVLVSNQQKLVSFLQNFLEDKVDDDQFLEEKRLLIATLQHLTAPKQSSNH
ncbi:hypothetical protein WA158_004112 [Blastocystis sp. Blastoise]